MNASAASHRPIVKEGSRFSALGKLHRLPAMRGGLIRRHAGFQQHAHRVGMALLMPPAGPVQRRIPVGMPVGRVKSVLDEHPGDLRTPLKRRSMHWSVPVLLGYCRVRTQFEEQLDRTQLSGEHRSHYEQASTSHALPSGGNGLKREVQVGGGTRS